MKSSDALRLLAELSSSQWGMVTSAQGSMRGVTRLDLSRLAEAGHLVRLAHGVYMDAGAPGDEFDDLRAAWLSTAPDRLAESRLSDRPSGVVIAGASAARLHSIGDLPASRHDFVSPVRRQSQRQEIRYRQRALDPRDVTLVEALPVMTVERTIADLIEDRQDLSLVADALRDASDRRVLDLDRLRELLAPLAERNGFRKGDGSALLNRLMEIAGIDLKALARRIASTPDLGALVAANFARSLPNFDLARLVISPEMERGLQAISDSVTKNFRDALQPQSEKLNLTASAALAPALENVFKDVISPKLAEMVVGDAFRAVSKDWATSLKIGTVPSADLISLARLAQQAAGDA